MPLSTLLSMSRMRRRIPAFTRDAQAPVLPVPESPISRSLTKLVCFGGVNTGIWNLPPTDLTKPLVIVCQGFVASVVCVNDSCFWVIGAVGYRGMSGFHSRLSKSVSRKFLRTLGSFEQTRREVEPVFGVFEPLGNLSVSAICKASL